MFSCRENGENEKKDISRLLFSKQEKWRLGFRGAIGDRVERQSIMGNEGLGFLSKPVPTSKGFRRDTCILFAVASREIPKGYQRREKATKIYKLQGVGDDLYGPHRLYREGD
jgi:hypothetical protein